MKRIFAALLVLLALAACADRAADAPVWQTQLAGGGTLSISGCTVSEETGEYLTAAGASPETLPLLQLYGVPTLTITGAAETDISIQYARPDSGSYCLYNQKVPEEALDYILTREDDGTLRYRIDTVYSYCLTVGQERWLLVCSRDI